MSHYLKCMVIKVHFSHFVCVSGVAFLRLTEVSVSLGINNKRRQQLQKDVLMTMESGQQFTLLPSGIHVRNMLPIYMHRSRMVLALANSARNLHFTVYREMFHMSATLETYVVFANKFFGSSETSVDALVFLTRTVAGDKVENVFSVSPACRKRRLIGAALRITV